MKKSKPSDVKVERRSKDERDLEDFHLNLTHEQCQFLRSLDNASAFIRDLLDEHMKSKATEVEEPSKFSAVEEEILRYMVDLGWAVIEGAAIKPSPEQIERRIGIWNAKDFDGSDEAKSLLRSLAKDERWFERHLEMTEEDKAQWEEATSYLNEEITRRLRIKREKYLSRRITENYTLGELREELGDPRNNRITIDEVMKILEKGYDWTYRNVITLLEREGYNVARKKR